MTKSGVRAHIHYEDDRGYFEFEMKNSNQGDVPLFVTYCILFLYMCYVVYICINTCHSHDNKTFV